MVQHRQGLMWSQPQNPHPFYEWLGYARVKTQHAYRKRIRRRKNRASAARSVSPQSTKIEERRQASSNSVLPLCWPNANGRSRIDSFEARWRQDVNNEGVRARAVAA